MKEFKSLKKLVLLPLVGVLLLSGCFLFDDPIEKSETHMVGFASDTTAILFRRNWVETAGGGLVNGGTNELSLELMLVDVRFSKVYWRSRVEKDYGRHFWTSQWNDSAILINEEMLWAIGESKPHKVNFILEGAGLENFDKKTLRLQIPPNGHILDLYNGKQWKNETVLMWRDTTSTGNLPEYLLLDRKNFVISVWQPSAEERELMEKGAFWDGEKFIYLENECKSENLSCCYKGLCECLETEPCKAFVFSGSGDTLHTVGHYPYIERQESFIGSKVFDKRCGFRFLSNGKLVSIRSLALADDYYPYSLPATLLPKDTSGISAFLPKDYYGRTKFRLIEAVVSIDKNKKELLNPSFWFWHYGDYGEGIRFADSIGNVWSY